jgi:uncharacterized membrane protein YtjA (UPF0391 family)
MLTWSLAFLIVAIIAGIFGFGGIAAGATEMAQVLFIIFLAVFVVSLARGLLHRRPPRPRL